MKCHGFNGKNSEYDQEIPQSQTADNPVAPWIMKNEGVWGSIRSN